MVTNTKTTAERLASRIEEIETLKASLYKLQAENKVLRARSFAPAPDAAAVKRHADDLTIDLEASQNDVKRLRVALGFLIFVKNHKEKEGRDDWYKQTVNMAWDNARFVFSDI